MTQVKILTRSDKPGSWQRVRKFLFRLLSGARHTTSMKNLSEFQQPLQFLLTDIDDTLTDEGRLGSEAYSAMWTLHNAGIKIIPVTGRPAGWCEMIARQWPVAGVVGENGAFTFFYEKQKMQRHFAIEESQRLHNQEALKLLQSEILNLVPGTAVASDQFCRMFDLAIDFAEDVPRLSQENISRIVQIFQKQGAQAKVSSIHVNGWFGSYNKLSESLFFLKNHFALSPEQIKLNCGFIGDSPNDEPMWEYFPNSFGVANVLDFNKSLKNPPQYICKNRGGLGFAELAQRLLQLQK